MSRRSLLVLLLVAGSCTALAQAPPGHARGRLIPPPTPERAYVARIVVATEVRRRPWDTKSFMRLDTRATWGGGINQLLVLDSVRIAGADGVHRLWLRVHLPTRPNGSSGWIQGDSAVIRSTPYRVVVSTRKRRIKVYRKGKLVRQFRAVVGAPSTPTPHGRFAISEPIPQPNPKAFLGPWALHLTAHSNVLEDYGGGPGRVAIHGRAGASLNDPLGTARSHGCVRINNVDVRWLERVTIPGTPVVIGA